MYQKLRQLASYLIVKVRSENARFNLEDKQKGGITLVERDMHNGRINVKAAKDAPPIVSLPCSKSDLDRNLVFRSSR
jgi:hypothetical protein